MTVIFGNALPHLKQSNTIEFQEQASHFKYLECDTLSEYDKGTINKKQNLDIFPGLCLQIK